MDSSGSTPSHDGSVIGIGLQKGGVAKTTNSLHLAAALGERDRRVLLWDLDENYGATKVLISRKGAEGFPTTYSVLAGDCTVEEAILSYDDDELDIALPTGVDFIPSSRLLAKVGPALEQANSDSFYNVSDCLRPFIPELRALGRYDYIVLDTGPQASPTTKGAYMVADYFILSVQPEKQAVHSIPDSLQDITNARKPGRNEKLHLLGLIISALDRRKTLAKRYEADIAKQFRDANHEPVKFKATIGTAAAIESAYDEKKTLLQFEPSHRVSQQYRDLAAEVEQRIHDHRLRVSNTASQPQVTQQPEVAANG